VEKKIIQLPVTQSSSDYTFSATGFSIAKKIYSKLPYDEQRKLQSLDGRSRANCIHPDSDCKGCEIKDHIPPLCGAASLMAEIVKLEV